jgi:hypothetical protein
LKEAGGSLLEARSSSATNKKPTNCLLGACSGRQLVGYRFSLLTLLFSGVIDSIYLTNGAMNQVLQNFTLAQFYGIFTNHARARVLFFWKKTCSREVKRAASLLRSVRSLGRI